LRQARRKSGWKSGVGSEGGSWEVVVVREEGFGEVEREVCLGVSEEGFEDVVGGGGRGSDERWIWYLVEERRARRYSSNWRRMNSSEPM